MMKQLLVLPTLWMSLTAMAQNEPKVPVIGMAPSMYILHQVQPGETISAIATMYGESVGNVMRLNGMNAKSQLSASQIINIPVSAAKIKQIPGGLALTHVVGAGESLYRISVNHGKVPLASLQQWNHLPGNAISLGQELIVGYLPVSGSSAGASAAASRALTLQSNVPAAGVVTPQVSTPKPAETPVTNSESVIKPTVLSSVPPASPATTPAATSPAPQSSPPASSATTVTPAPATEAPGPRLIPGESFFARQFGKNVEGREKKTKTGNAAIFKTAAGWADRKYYIMMDAVPPGQIVEVSNTAGKKIYAKVLWHMRDMKENEGYTYRLSNAGAAALGFSELKFDIIVTYFE